jgi:hypothetical protein
MAYQSKAEQRMAGSTDYSASEGTLNSDSVKEMKDMGKAPEKIWGKQGGGKVKNIYGKVETRSGQAGLNGKLAKGATSYSKGK